MVLMLCDMMIRQSKELPDLSAVQEDYEEPPEWDIKEGEETIVSGLSAFLDGR